MPAMAADMHRARILTWELPKLGWDVEILSPDTTFQPISWIDSDSTPLFASGVTNHSVSEFCSACFRLLGIGNIGWRAILPLYRAGLKLLKQRRFDVIYISTAHFPLFLLGILWRRHNVPFVLDFHDPLFNGEAIVLVPGHIKRAIAHWLSQYIESRCVRAAAGVIAVSPEYIATLYRRYAADEPAWLGVGRTAVIPFPAAPRDLEVARSSVREIGDTRTRRVVYVGTGGSIMRRSFEVFCSTLSLLQEQEPELLASLRFEFYGTSPSNREGETTTFTAIARAYAVSDLVFEYPQRVSYRRSLELLLGSDGALVLGVDDSGYMPSKLFNYVLSGKPLLAALRAGSAAFTLFQGAANLGHVIEFGEAEEAGCSERTQTLRTFVREVAARKSFDRRSILEPYLAANSACRHIEVFDACLK
ncbi:MAG: glycosyltransferase [Rhizobiales bacterium]|nr:glycosyltransferase [Hyphomicrobiales bacterium]